MSGELSRNCSIFPAADVCPDKYAQARAFLALLPRGRAWGNHDGGPGPRSILWLFWLAVGNFYTYINDRICAVKKEFFCFSAAETADWWAQEFGLPDGCEPFPSICAKILWHGAQVCASWTTILARAGWDIVSCQWQNGDCGAVANCSQANCAQSGGLTPAGSGILILSVSLSGSPAYLGPIARPSRAGCMLAGDQLACPPDLSGLNCVLARIIPAHATVEIEVLP